MKKLAIEQASDEQLRDFAVTVHQLDKVPHDRAGIIGKLVESGYTQDYIVVPGDAPQASQESEELGVLELGQFEEVGEVPQEMPATGFSFWTKGEAGKPPCPMVTCRILTTERPGGNDPAAPIINNSPPLVIPRGKLVRIPYDFYQILKQAGGTSAQSNIADATKEAVKFNYIEYPMTDVQLPTGASVAAWNAWAGQHELGRPKAVAA